MHAMTPSAFEAPRLRSIAWSSVVWLAVLAVALVDHVVGGGHRYVLWVAMALAVVLLIGTHVRASWWIRGSLWVLVPLAAFLVWQIALVLQKDPHRSADIGVEIMIVVYGTPIALGLGALLVWCAAWLGVAIGGGDRQ